MTTNSGESPALNRAVRKATLRLLPFLALMLVLAFLDRANIGFAKLVYQADTGISEAAYALGAGIFFIGYALFEVPSNLILHRVGARMWLSRIMVSWGLVSAAMLFAHTETTLYFLRFLLGVCEAGFYPGVLLYLTYWFPARHRARAIGLFYLGVPLSLVIGSPLSGYLLTFHDVFGLNNWQLMFAVEGLAATLVGVIAFFYLDNRPLDAKWLTDEEKAALAAVIAAEEQEKTPAAGHTALGVLKDRRVLAFIGVYFCMQVGAAPLVFYLPSKLAASMGGQVTFAVGLLLAIPWICSAIAIRAATLYADRQDNHRNVVIAMVTAGTLALASLGWLSSPLLIVIAACIAIPGLTASQPVFWSLPTRYLGGTAAASGIAFIVSIGNLGSFLSPQIKVHIDQLSGSGNAGFMVLALICAIGVLLLLWLRLKLSPLPAALAPTH